MLAVEGGFLPDPHFRFLERKGIEKAFEGRLILCSPVKNKVLLVNSKIKSGLDLEKGKETTLALFARSAYPELIEKRPGDQLLEVWPEHERSMLYRRQRIEDEGCLHGDIDLKGNGYTHNGKVELPGVGTVQGLFGLLDITNAYKEYENSEILFANGIRVPRVLAIIGLQEIIFEGGKISLEKARKRDVIRQNFYPVILVRAFGTRARVRDISETSHLSEETKRIILDDAKELAGDELGRKKVDRLTDQEYMEWFAKSFGYNVGMLHRIGYVHQALSSHNVTLDVRLCDLDKVDKIEKQEQRKEEINFIMNHSLKSMVLALKLPESQFYIAANNFQKSYYSAFHEGERRYSW